MSPLDVIKQGLEKGYTVEVIMNSTQKNYEVLICSQQHVEKFNVPVEEVSPETLGRVLWKK